MVRLDNQQLAKYRDNILWNSKDTSLRFDIPDQQLLSKIWDTKSCQK